MGANWGGGYNMGGNPLCPHGAVTGDNFALIIRKYVLEKYPDYPPRFDCIIEHPLKSSISQRAKWFVTLHQG